MCRNIKKLYKVEPPVTEQEILAASLQYVRKISGFQKPSKANEEAFKTAITEIAKISETLLNSLTTRESPPHHQLVRSSDKYLVSISNSAVD